MKLLSSSNPLATSYLMGSTTKTSLAAPHTLLTPASSFCSLLNSSAKATSSTTAPLDKLTKTLPFFIIRSCSVEIILREEGVSGQ